MSQFDDLKAAILYYVWKNSQRVGELVGFNLTQLEDFLPPECLSGMTRAAIHSLSENGFLEETSRAYFITEAGIRSIEYDLGHPDNIASELQKAEILRDGISLGEPVSSHRMVPGSDRVVRLDHNSDPYREAIAALDQALAEFRADRLLENEWGPEKGILLRTIEAGRELLEEGEARAATIFSTIIAPLQIVRDRYDHAIVAGLVTAGADQLIASISHAISSVLSLVGLS